MSLINTQGHYDTVFTLSALLTKIKWYCNFSFSICDQEVILACCYLVVHRSVSYAHSITFDISKDRVVQDFEQLPGKVNGGLGEIVDL